MTEPEPPQASADQLSLDFDALAAATVADRGDVWILHWLRNAESAVSSLDEESVKVAQADLEKALVRLVSQPAPASQAAPKPGRPVRNITARILIKLYARAEQRPLYDVVSALLRVAGAEPAKGAGDNKEHRVASFYVAGEVFKAHGLQVMSQFADTVSTSTRVIRSTSLPPILRYQALLCLNGALVAGARTLGPTDALSKDVLKTLRTTLSDKTSVVVRGTVDCLLTLCDASELLRPLAEVESLASVAIRGFDAADFATRRSLARLVAALLASTQVAGSAATAPLAASTSAGAKKAGEAEDDEDDPYPSGAVTAEEKAKTLLKPIEMLALLATPYAKPATPRKVRNGIVDAYAALFGSLGTDWVEAQYADVFKHIVRELGVPKPTVTTASQGQQRHEMLVGRKLAGLLLRDVIGVQLLTEQGQVAAVGEIASSVLSRWPALMPGSRAPTKFALVLALDEVSGLLRQLGSATQPVQDALYEPLLRLLGHTSHSVQVAAALCLRTFCHAAPTRLAHTTSHVLDLVSKDLAQLGQPGAPADIARRAVGHARGLAALMSVVAGKPLYVSLDISAKVMSLAIQLLKQSATHDLHISAVEINVAWTIVAALMGLGPSFVRLHLPQLLILWKNALPKPSAKDASAAQVRSENEWGFLLHVRECALGAMLAFLRYNADRLLTLDAGRRIVAMLSNGLAFLTDFATRHAQLLQEQSPSTTSTLRLVDRDLLLRRRLLQCFATLGRHPSVEPLHQALLTFSLGVFADPERYTGSQVQAAIAASSGTFTTVWDSADGFTYGVTTFLQSEDADAFSTNEAATGGDDWINRDLTEVAIEAVLHQPGIDSEEHDALILSAKTASDVAPKPAPPPATGAVDAGIEVFATYLLSAAPTVQANALQQLSACVRSTKLERNPGRRMAILVNAVAALLVTLRQAGGLRRQPDGPVLSAMRDVFKEALLHPDTRLRNAAAEGFGRLAAIGGSPAMSSLVQLCVSQIVGSTDPDARAGCVVALGQVYGHVGSLQAGPVLKTLVDVLMSLSADPHPLVHFWSLRSLAGVISTAGLAYGPFLNGTLGMAVKLYMADTHEPEGGSMGSVNLRGDLPAYQDLCKILDAIIGVLGPELQASDQVRELVHALISEFAQEPGEGIKVEALKSLQHLMLFVTEGIDMPKTVATLKHQLASPRRPMRVAVVNTIYQLVQRNAGMMSRVGGDRLVVDLFTMLDSDPTIEGVRPAILSWLRQTADANPSGWIDLCQRIIARTTAAQPRPQAVGGGGGDGPEMMDEEIQGFGVEGQEGSGKAPASNSRWRTQLFALQCLHEVFLAVIRAGRREHFDVATAKAKGYASLRPLMLARVTDVVRMAFTASTASIMEIRLEGLVVLRDVIENFKGSGDVDFEEALLLEQYQAPIAAALTPAFAADSFPEVLASAIQVCAVFVGSGVVKEIGKMGRILKLLTGALESCRDAEIFSVGDMRDLSSTASVMIKTAVFAAWAEFVVASSQQAYLVDVIKPHLGLLCSAWVATLREYARLSADADASGGGGGGGGGPPGGGFDVMQASLTREIALPYYAKAWLRIMRATSLLLKADDPFMAKAIDGVDPASPATELVVNGSAGDRKGRPALYWPVVFGLAFEAAATSTSASDDPSAPANEAMETALMGLEALSAAGVAGDAFEREDVFDEVCNLCYRLAGTETARSQVLVIRVVLQVARTVGEPKAQEAKARAEQQITQCLRVIVQILTSAVPGLSSMATSKARKAPLQHGALINTALVAYADLAGQRQQLARDQAFAVAFGLYAMLLKDESSGVDLVGPSLPGLRTLLEGALAKHPAPSSPSSDLSPRVVHGLLSHALQNAEEVRGREGPAAGLKLRSNLLASTLVLTTIPDGVPVSRAALEHCCVLVAGLASSPTPEVSATAIHCAKSLILSRHRSSPLLAVSVGHLLPGLVEAVAKAAESAEPADAPVQQQQQQQQQVAVATTEIVRVLVGLVAIVEPARRRDALAVVLPIVSILLDPSVPVGPRQGAVGQVLQLASSDASTFRAALLSLDPVQRSTMEGAMRGAVQRPDLRLGPGGGAGLPTIELRSFG